jgi:hypothetical protein
LPGSPQAEVAILSTAFATNAVETDDISHAMPPSEPLNVAASFPSTSTCDLKAENLVALGL